MMERTHAVAKSANLPFLGNDLMKEIADPANIERAWAAELRKDGSLTLARKGWKRKYGRSGKASGIDGKSVLDAYHDHMRDPDLLREALLNGDYEPSPVRRKTIPKPNGGERHLGIPTAEDRVVQQAIRQILEPRVEPHFSASSYGFRPKRSVHDAAAEVKAMIDNGAKYTVDMDLSKYFDTVPHDRSLEILRGITRDVKLLSLICRFLKAGVSVDGIIMPTDAGVPQGGVISPLLSNLYLHQLDMELEACGHAFCRYADDFIILVKCRRAAHRVSKRIAVFLTDLGLTVNTEKSKVAPVSECSFLGFDIRHSIQIGTKAIEAFKERVRVFSMRGSDQDVLKRMDKLRTFINGWFAHYGRIKCDKQILDLHEWFISHIQNKLADYRGTGPDPLPLALDAWLKAIGRTTYWKNTLESCFCDLKALQETVNSSGVLP